MGLKLTSTLLLVVFVVNLGQLFILVLLSELVERSELYGELIYIHSSHMTYLRNI